MLLGSTKFEVIVQRRCLLVRGNGLLTGRLSINGGKLSIKEAGMSINPGTLSINVTGLSINRGELSITGHKLSINTSSQ